MIMISYHYYFFARRNDHLLCINGNSRPESCSPVLSEGTKKYTRGAGEYQKVSFTSKESCLSLLGSNAISTKIFFKKLSHKKEDIRNCLNPRYKLYHSANLCTPKTKKKSLHWIYVKDQLLWGIWDKLE